MQIIWANTALTPEGWQSAVRIAVDGTGAIATVDANSPPEGVQVGIALSAPGNLHSHGFQRTLAGLTETRSENSTSSFWSWRKLMYEFIDQLMPEEIEAITTYAQIEMLESGFAAVAEFHYVHHQSDGQHYGDIAELSSRIIAAAEHSGIGLTLLPVFYQYGGCRRKPPLPQQRRFINSMDGYHQFFEKASLGLQNLPQDSRMGMAVHSLRAVDPIDLAMLRGIRPHLPLHLHVAEQMKEIEEFESCYGVRPVEWLCQHSELNDNWCLVHATHMTETETRDLAQSRAVVGLCPMTEANLGDGIFNGVEYTNQKAHYGVGTDSNVRVSLCEELRTLEYSQRLKHHQRAILSQPGYSCGRTLFESALLGASLALGRLSGSLKAGNFADILALDSESEQLACCQGDEILDTFVFSGDNRLVSDVWVAGRHVVREGCHINRQPIQDNYLMTKKKIMQRLIT